MRGRMIMAALAISALAGSGLARADGPVTVDAITAGRLNGGTPVDASATFPSGDWSKVSITFSDAPTCDSWDRLFAVLVDGVEVLHGTTPRTAFSVSQDVTQYQRWLSGTRTVTVHLDNYHDGSETCPAPGETYHTASVSFTFTPGAAPAGTPDRFAHPYSFDFLAPTPDDWACQNLISSIDTTRTFEVPAGAITHAGLYVYTSGHDCEEDWFLDPTPVPARLVHVFLDDTEIATFAPLPYTYAFVGQYGGERNNGTLGEPLHQAAWWTAQKAMNENGAHTGVGVIPPYVFDVTGAIAAAGAGPHAMRVVIDHGDDYWMFSAELLIA